MADCAIARNHVFCQKWSGRFLHISDRRVNINLELQPHSLLGTAEVDPGKSPCLLKCLVVTTTVKLRLIAVMIVDCAPDGCRRAACAASSRVKGAPVASSYREPQVSVLATNSDLETRSRKWQVGPVHDLRS